jgi:hypothetical protein
MTKVAKASMNYGPAPNNYGSPAVVLPATVEMKPQETADRLARCIGSAPQ